MTIKFILKSVYGKKLYYPNCDKSRILCDLLKQKTMHKNQLDLISNIFKIEVEIGV
jgi:hypothetical protein